MNMRPAEIGDEGVVLGLESHGSIATLILQVGEGEQVYLYGGWRMAANLVEAFAGECVEIVGAEGSVYGAHGIRSLRATSY